MTHEPDNTHSHYSVRRSRFRAAGLLAMTAMLAGSFSFGGGRSSYAERHDPNRPKTPEDLERMEAARLRREKKAVKRKAQNTTTTNTPTP